MRVSEGGESIAAGACVSAACAEDRSREGSGFTLVELVLAMALIGGAFLSLLFLRTEAVDRAGAYNLEGEVQRLAQEKLDEVVYALDDNTEGTFEDFDEQFRDFRWSVESVLVSTSGPELLECTITVFYPDGGEEEAEYQLSTWFFPEPEHPLLSGLEHDTEASDGY